MPSYAISGPRTIDARIEEKVLVDMLDELRDATTIYSGAQYGIDTLGARAAVLMKVELVLVVPNGKSYNEDLLKLTKRVVSVDGGYLKRDDRLAELATRLVAYPPTLNEELRSGTWATIRRFCKLYKDVRYRPLTMFDPI